jgi:hypothetical protein
MDVTYLGLVLLFSALTLALIAGCRRLGGKK